MNEPPLHVTFSSSGYEVLRLALVRAGRKDEVIYLADSLNIGPIDTSDFQERQIWIKAELGIDEDWVEKQADTFWDKIVSDTRTKILWTSRRSASEYSGFLECLWRLGNTPCSVVDMTEVKVRYRKDNGEFGPPVLAICLPVLGEHEVLNNGVLNLPLPLTSEDRESYHAVWKRLRMENAAFRVVGPNGIASAPITYFDDLVLSCVSPVWQKSARVIGDVMGKEDFYYIQSNDLVYFSRLQNLIAVGLVESRGDISKMRESEVRLSAIALRT